MYNIQHKIECLTNAALKSPEYAGIVPIFIELYRYLGQVNLKSGISFDLTKDDLAKRLQTATPLLSAKNIIVDVETCRNFLAGIIEVLTRMGNTNDTSLDAIASAIETGKLDLDAIFCFLMERNRDAINNVSEKIGVPAALLEYIFQFPLKKSLEELVEKIEPEKYADWQQGFCPVCAAKAGMAELTGEEGRRFLYCQSCTFSWQYKRLQCPACENENTETLGYFSVADEPTRVDFCKACNRYIKTRDSRKGNVDIPLEIEELLTIHLDLLANREGLVRASG